MKLLSNGQFMLMNGAKPRFELNAADLEKAGEKVKKLIKNVKDPVVQVGVNGRGNAGSVYGVKVFERGIETPVAAVAGRIDYREPQPILQVRGFVRNNAGNGDALRGNLTLDRNQRMDIEGMDEYSFSKKKGDVELHARSPWLNADIKGNKDDMIELGAKLGFLENIISGRAKMAQNMNRARTKIADALFNMNPLNKTKRGVRIAAEKAAPMVTDAKAFDKTMSDIIGGKAKEFKYRPEFEKKFVKKGFDSAIEMRKFEGDNPPESL